MKVIIVGGVAGGASFAARLREMTKVKGDRLSSEVFTRTGTIFPG